MLGDLDRLGSGARVTINRRRADFRAVRVGISLPQHGGEIIAWVRRRGVAA